MKIERGGKGSGAEKDEGMNERVEKWGKRAKDERKNGRAKTADITHARTTQDSG